MSTQTKTTPTHQLCHDNEEIWRGSEAECFGKLHRMVGYSVDHATKHEGWSIEPLNLNPLHEIFEHGRTEIWYMTPERETHQNERAELNTNRLHETHKLLGRIDCTDLEELFTGEIWSPMSPGDVVRLPDGATYLCEDAGWLRVDDPTID